jgi:hypothetical protein
MQDFTEAMRQGMRELRAARQDANGLEDARVRLAISNLETLCDADVGSAQRWLGAIPDDERSAVGGV